MSSAFEHITIDGEADHRAPAGEPPPRATVRRYALAAQPGERSVELTVLEGRHLRVRAGAPDGTQSDYQFDLRFAAPTPVRERRVPWRWMLAASAVTASGLAALVLAWPATIALLGTGLTAGLLLALAAGSGAFVGLRWSVESLSLCSMHGGAALLSVSGRLGSSRRHQAVFTELSAQVLAAQQARPQDKAKFLRDEMREHYRLRQLGVLSEKTYEASKAAILAAH